jgi:uncharacterized radical SAM superfamily Fe-S cluster-containing enzyme
MTHNFYPASFKEKIQVVFGECEEEQALPHYTKTTFFHSSTGLLHLVYREEQEQKVPTILVIKDLQEFEDFFKEKNLDKDILDNIFLSLMAKLCDPAINQGVV